VRHALLLGWLAFVVLLAGVSPGHAWLDTGELAAAAVELGVPHPPGAVGFAAVGRAFAALPVGALGFRVALASAAAAAVSVAAVGLVVLRHRVPPAIVWAVGPWILASWTFVLQARVAEIYAFGTLLALAAIWGVDPGAPEPVRDRARLLAVFLATVAALGFGDLRLGLVPWLGVLWLLDARRGRPWVRWAPLVAVTAACAVATLPLAAARAPVTDWGHPSDWAGVIDHLSARSIRESFHDEVLPASLSLWRLHFDAVQARLVEDLGPVGWLIALFSWGAAPVVTTDPRTRRLAWGVAWLVLVELFYATGVNPMGGADRQTGMLLAPLAAISVALVLGRVVAVAPRLAWAVVPLVWVAVVAPAFVGSRHEAAAARSWMPQAWTLRVLDRFPPGTTLLTQSDDLAAGCLYAAVVEGARPDIACLPVQHLHRPVPARWRETGTVADVAWRAGGGLDAAAAAARILATVPGPVAVESPGAALLEDLVGVDGEVAGPVTLVRRGGQAGPAKVAGLGAELDAWRAELHGAEDRRRLAATLGLRVRAALRAGADPVRAAGDLRTILTEVAPQHVPAMVALASVLEGLGRRDDAVALLRAALELEPGRPAALENLARALLHTPGAGVEALELARLGARLRPWRPQAQDVLAQALEANGLRDEAQQARERAATAGAARR
jgi:hypothetical protein